MTVIERIYEFIENLDITINEFSNKIGVSNGYLAKQKAHSGNVGSHILSRITELYPQLSTRWLLNGKGEMLETTSAVYRTEDAAGSYVNETDPAYRSSGSQQDFQRKLLHTQEELIRDKEEIIRLQREQIARLEKSFRS